MTPPPRTLDDLLAAAQGDLETPRRGVLLKWVGWHALAVAARARYERECRKLDQREWETALKLGALPVGGNQSVHELVAAAGPHPVDVSNAGDLYVEAVAYEQACAHVLSLVRSRAAKVTAKPQARSLPARRAA